MNHSALVDVDQWSASLKLSFAPQQGRTALIQRQHHGPLLVQKALYPEGPEHCHLLLLHPPGGIAGGDSLSLQLELAEDCRVVMSTPGASKWYKANGRASHWSQQFQLADRSILEWLPQENLIYNRAEANSRSTIHLIGNACYFGWEINVLGRLASGELFTHGYWAQHNQIWRDGKLLWQEAQHLTGDDVLMHSPLGLAGFPVFAQLVLAVADIPAELLARCRELVTPEQSRVGISALPGVLIARLLGHNAIQARLYFERLWQVLRPFYAGREAQSLRIWRL